MVGSAVVGGDGRGGFTPCEVKVGCLGFLPAAYTRWV